MNGKRSNEFVSINGIKFEPVDDYLNILSYHEPFWHLFHITTIWLKMFDNVIVTSPGMPFSPYEKLFLPFDRLTWIFLGCTFSIGFFVIFVVNQMRKEIQNIFYGKGIKTPAVNFLQIVFGIGMTKLPRNTFARAILIQFIVFCFVLRNGYQGDKF
jgi:hypothetical protein